MIELLKTEYWSKSEAFLLPLTGLARTQKYKIETYLFWENYSIEDYYLVVKFTYENYNEFVDYCRRIVFPALDKNGYLVESYDFVNETVLVLNISEWAKDIEMFLVGKYSKMSRDAKDTIVEYHTFYDKGNKIMIEIQAAIEPNVKYDVLEKKTPIEYVAENYGLSYDELKKGGEVGGIYNKEKETLKDLKEHDNYLQKEGSTLK